MIKRYVFRAYYIPQKDRIILREIGINKVSKLSTENSLKMFRPKGYTKFIKNKNVPRGTSTKQFQTMENGKDHKEYKTVNVQRFDKAMQELDIRISRANLDVLHAECELDKARVIHKVLSDIRDNAKTLVEFCKDYRPPFIEYDNDPKDE